MSGDYYLLLWRRAERFLVRATRDLDEEDYDGACFNSEEALQLATKALLFKYFAETPRIHGSKTLLARLRNLLLDGGRAEEARIVGEFVSGKRRSLDLLEESYIMARYGSIMYGEIQARECLETAREGFRVLREVERRLG